MTSVFAAETTQQASTPPRLSLIQGTVSLRRPSGLYEGNAGGENWVTPPLNVPLAVGDSLRVEGNSLAELQFGPQSWLRLAAFSHLTLTEQTDDFVSFRLVSGQAFIDLRALPPGHGLAMDIPSGQVSIDRAGAYRVELGQVGSAAQTAAQGAAQTSLLVRRGGRMTLATADGQTRTIASGQELLLGAQGRVDSFNARSQDSWERWNDQRSDEVLGLADSASRRYLPDGMYGGAELDRYGAWQAHQDYGPVWVPNGVASDWTPYSTGQWVNDPGYGWSWVDQAAWGWTPFHYGRWVYVNSYWAWAPGPRVNRPIYAPALVGLVRSPIANAGYRSPFGAGVGWTPLAWGEPITPWWGRQGFRGQAYWGGWAGPRVVTPGFQNHAYANAVIAARPNSIGFGLRDLVRVPQHQHRDWQAHGAGFGHVPGVAVAQGTAPGPTQAPAPVFGQAFGAPAQVFGAPKYQLPQHQAPQLQAPQHQAPQLQAPQILAHPQPAHRPPQPYIAPPVQLAPQPINRAPAMVAPNYRGPAMQAPVQQMPPAMQRMNAPAQLYRSPPPIHAPMFVAQQRPAPPPVMYVNRTGSAPAQQGQARGYHR